MKPSAPRRKRHRTVATRVTANAGVAAAESFLTPAGYNVQEPSLAGASEEHLGSRSVVRVSLAIEAARREHGPAVQTGADHPPVGAA